MKCWKISLLVALLFAPVCSEEFELEIISSPTHGLYYTLECLMNAPHRSEELAESFRGRVGNWYPVQKAMDQWRKSLEGDELSTLRFPRVQGRTPNLVSVLEKVSLQSNDAADMAQRVSPWLGPDHARSLLKVLTTVEPLYQQYWWSEAAPLMEKRMAEVAAQLEQGDFSDSFERAARFYDGQLPPGERPTLALVPYLRMPGQSRVGTHGHSAGSLQVMELVVDRPVDDDVGVVFHEFVHALYAGQREEERQRWEERFASHGLWGKLAYAKLNEGLATALGNGWFQEKVLGELDNGSWYSDPVIDTYGKALLPVIREAVEAGRPPTDQELDRMVEAFRESLPDAADDFNVVGGEILTVSSRAEINHARFQDALMRLGPVRSSRARDWEAEPVTVATFRLYWLLPGERGKLADLGWSESDRTGWETHRLRQTESGWELAFEGDHEVLFALLGRLQREGLSEHSD